MDYLLFLFVLVVQAVVILYPELLNELLFFRIPRASRMDAERHVPVAAIALLVFTVLFFDSVYRDHPVLFPAPEDAGTIYPRYVVGAVFALLGLLFCIRPAGTLHRVIPPMRRVPVSSIEANSGLIRLAKAAGIVQMWVGLIGCFG